MLEVSIEQIKKLLEQIKSNYNILLDELDSYSRNNIKIVKITSPSYSESVSIKNRIDYDVEITGEIYFNFTFTNSHEVEIHNFKTEIVEKLGYINSNDFKCITSINKEDSKIIETLLEEIPSKKHELNILKLENLFKKLK